MGHWATNRIFLGGGETFFQRFRDKLGFFFQGFSKNFFSGERLGERWKKKMGGFEKRAPIQNFRGEIFLCYSGFFFFFFTPFCPKKFF